MITWVWDGLVHLLVPRHFLGGSNNQLCANFGPITGENYSAMVTTMAAAEKAAVERIPTCLHCAIDRDYVKHGD
jgi:hypothetical protein